MLKSINFTQPEIALPLFLKVGRSWFVRRLYRACGSHCYGDLVRDQSRQATFGVNDYRVTTAGSVRKQQKYEIEGRKQSMITANAEKLKIYYRITDRIQTHKE